MLHGELAQRPPAQYWPLSAGRYEVKPALQRFGTDFGNGGSDRQIFQIDQQFPHYRRIKLEVRSSAMDEYVLTHKYSEPVAAAVSGFIARRLATDHPTWFGLEQTSSGWKLHCDLTSECLVFDPQWRLVDTELAMGIAPRYISALDALACQVQEDLAVTVRLGW